MINREEHSNALLFLCRWTFGLSIDIIWSYIRMYVLYNTFKMLRSIGSQEGIGVKFEWKSLKTVLRFQVEQQ